MENVKIDRGQLLTIISENKEKHVQEYNEAVEDYKKAVLVIAQGNLKLAKSADPEKFKDIKPYPGAPVSYESKYARAIRMLELSVDNVITLETEAFNQLVLDDWHWKQQFAVSNAFYKTVGGLG